MARRRRAFFRAKGGADFRGRVSAKITAFFVCTYAGRSVVISDEPEQLFMRVPEAPGMEGLRPQPCPSPSVKA